MPAQAPRGVPEMEESVRRNLMGTVRGQEGIADPCPFLSGGGAAGRGLEFEKTIFFQCLGPHTHSSTWIEAATGKFNVLKGSGFDPSWWGRAWPSSISLYPVTRDPCPDST